MERITVSSPDPAAAPAAGVPTPDPQPAAPQTVQPTGTETLLAGKFKDAAALEQAYLALQSKLGASSPAPATPAADAPAQAPTVPPVTGLDISKYEAEFAKDGAISEQSIAELAAHGISPAMVSAYIDGQQAKAAQSRAEVFAVVGGESAYTDLQRWASANLNAAERAAFNRIVESGDMASTKLAVAGLHARFKSAFGAPPQGAIQGAAAAPASNGYSGWGEVTAAMADPRYQSDPAYRKQVADRLATSRF